ncbi:ferrous iron transport protein B [Paenibacillus segetis]|uniref:Ferrous iron transport protein B n=1 Tax=Paenibacillus segetis TaxID=1325360 RepID=A0ABQ1Y6T5_9BACL|nr:ferrous iron transport protein B [Paenibacillus segetis]GGH13853.1 ferrous iron transport protein B [Paenibacillus segetis]
MSYRFALAGNPNSGKTTLFNSLTGNNAHVGNWPGVTVERKEGKCKKTSENIMIVDLPGIYSLSPYTPEEIVARDFLTLDRPDAIINIVDATNIERNLYLTTQLLELGIPTIIALNMMDELELRGDKIDIINLEKQLGVPVVPITASKNQGITELLEKALSLELGHDLTHKNALNNSKICDTIQTISDLLTANGYSNTLYNAIKLMEKDEKIKDTLKLSPSLNLAVDKAVAQAEHQTGQEIEMMIADLRYKYITESISKFVQKGRKEGDLTFSDKIDKIVTHRILGLPIFFLIMYLVFQVAVGTIGAWVVDPFSAFLTETLPNVATEFLTWAGASEVTQGLVVGGIITGLGNILSFLPQIILLFLCLSVLEDIGYMSRVAFVMDRLFQYFGLSGKAFVPLLMGYGCSVPAIMATRTLEDEKSRRLAITLMPFMSCSARLPVYAVFAGSFFAAHQGLIVFSLYSLGIIVAMLSCLLLNKTVLKGDAAPFVMELPPYRIPTLKATTLHTWEKAKGYVIKVGTVLLTMSVAIWFLQTFNFSLQMVDDSSKSIFGVIGGAISPIFAWNGFGYIKDTGAVHWQIGAALLTGLIAKEAVVSTLGILYINQGTEELTGALSTALQTHFTPLAAFSVMVFVLLYVPCFAAIATAKKELNSWKWTLFTIAYQCGTAWLISMVVYQAGHFLGIGLA